MRMKIFLPTLISCLLGVIGASRCNGSEAETDASPPPQPPLFTQACSFCHGVDARGTERAPTLINPDHFHALSEGDIAAIIGKGRNKMPAFPFPPSDLQALAHYVISLNATASTALIAGDPKAGERIFFGSGQCYTCHMAEGRGSSLGPSLSSVGTRLTVAEMRQSLVDPSAAITEGYQTVSVELNDGSTVRGFARALDSHDVVLQTSDGKIRTLLDGEYRSVEVEKNSAMPAFQGTAHEQDDLVAFLSRLTGVGMGALAQPQAPVTEAEIDAIKHPRRGEWPTYNGRLDGNRRSDLDQVNLQNVGRLQLQWTYPIAFAGLETTPLVSDGVMYVTGNNQVFALSARTGSEIWRFERPKSDPAGISSDARIGVNRGVALLGDRVFYLTDNDHLLALDRLTGALLWEVDTPAEGRPGFYGATGAPLVVNDLVVTGTGGADDGIRGFVAAYKATTGELAWRFWTIPKYGETGPINDTWKGDALKEGGGSTWLTPSFDVDANILYRQIGNTHPDTDGDQRLGDNLYCNSDVALDPQTGKLLWHYQYTPHDVHDYDCNQPIVLVDTMWRGKDRRLLLHANRNGFLYVLDRTTGTPLMATQMVHKLTWATRINPQTWRPELLPGNEVTSEGVKTGPAVRGATNWYSTSFSPVTRLYYVMTVEDYTIFRKSESGGFSRYRNPLDPAQKILRAFNIETGDVAWQIAMPGTAENDYSGVLTTAGGVLFFGECTGGFSAVDERTGKYLWHFETHAHPYKGSPMTYSIDGRQYVAIAAGSNILSFALPDAP
jgi:PQQ-dependent dehydrogenase (methanol/ethanol family)